MNFLLRSEEKEDPQTSCMRPGICRSGNWKFWFQDVSGLDKGPKGNTLFAGGCGFIQAVASEHVGTRWLLS